MSACPVCSRPATGELPFASRQGARRLPIVQCAHCRHQFVAASPPAKELADFYDAYYSADRRRSQRVRPTWRDVAIAWRLKRLLPADARVLEIGCSFGQTLLAFPDGYRLHGVELSAVPARAAGTHRRLDVRQGFFEDTDLGGLEFDCVIANAVIEHAREPLVFLRRVERVLRPGGVLVLMTGDRGSWYARSRAESWALYHKMGHLHFFSQESLAVALESVGMRPVDWLWAGPTPLTVKLPRAVGRLLHSQATTLLVPKLQGRRRLGGNMYSWSVKPVAEAE